MASLLDYLVKSCAKKLEDIITGEVALVLGVKEDLKELRRTMTHIQCFLHDAERRRTEESSVNNWLGELRDAMYYADDIIDLARSEGGKLLTDYPSSSTKSTRCGGFSCFTCIPTVQKRHNIGVQIRDFNAKLEKLSELGERVLMLQNMLPRAEVPTVKHMRTSHHLVEPNLVGKETLHACKRLVELVLAPKEKKVYKVGIVGTGGIGKTTLAQKIYNDPKLEGAFIKKAWICISQEYSEVALLKVVLRNFAVHHEQDETVGELSTKLAAAVADKTFFMVLDDVWQPEVWTNLLRIPLHAAATGVILVTTRHDTVAHAIGVEYVHRVDLMSADVGWELLWKSMNLNEEKDVGNLRNMGLDIVINKCYGLPLAIKVTASVLATKEKTENEWRKFMDRSAWSMGNLPSELRGALYLSYDDLPSHLKHCFLYCALYPEDVVMYRNDLVNAWVAEGFIEQQQGQLLEDTAEEYYYELIHRNLLQPVRYVDHSACKMHDLLRQLACYISREECFIGDPESLGVINISKLRRFTAVTKKDIAMLPSMDKREFKLRTFRTDQKPWSVEETFFKRIPYIRVLSLSDSLIKSIPDYVRNLIHLRLLDLDGTVIANLPESVGFLMNLQVLNLSRCKALHSLPLTITQLSNLRRLGLKDTPINQVPNGIGRLEFLNDLDGFPIGGGGGNGKTQDGWKLEELKHLSELRELDMVKLEHSTPYSTYSLLADKKHLKVLHLCCTKRTDGPYSEEAISNTEKVFEQLIPPHNLEELVIYGFFGRRFPIWLGTTNLSSVKYLTLIYCNSCLHLPSIGQLPNLKYLKIHQAVSVTKIGLEFMGCRGPNPISGDVAVAFPKLEGLIFSNMPNLEEWSFVDEEDASSTTAAEGEEDISAETQKEEAPSPRLQLLPRLMELQIFDCPKLRALPRQLGQEATSLKKLAIERASCLKVVEDLPFLSVALFLEGCEGLERVSNLPQVQMLGIKGCPNLRRVEELGNLQRLVLSRGMREISSLWLPGLRMQCRQRDDEELELGIIN